MSKTDGRRTPSSTGPRSIPSAGNAAWLISAPASDANRVILYGSAASNCKTLR